MAKWAQSGNNSVKRALPRLQGPAGQLINIHTLSRQPRRRRTDSRSVGGELTYGSQPAGESQSVMGCWPDGLQLFATRSCRTSSEGSLSPHSLTACQSRHAQYSQTCLPLRRGALKTRCSRPTPSPPGRCGMKLRAPSFSRSVKTRAGESDEVSLTVQ